MNNSMQHALQALGAKINYIRMRFINKPPIDQLLNLTSSPGFPLFFGVNSQMVERAKVSHIHDIKMHMSYEFHICLVPISIYDEFFFRYVVVCKLRYFPIKASIYYGIVAFFFIQK